MGKENIDKIVESLSKLDPKVDDLYEDLGILVSDFAEVVNAKTPEEFTKQKKDCAATLKQFRKVFWNMTFFNTKGLRKEAVTEKATEKKPAKKGKHSKKEVNPFTADLLKDPNEFEDHAYDKE